MVDLIENLMCHFPFEGVEVEGSADSDAVAAAIVEAEGEVEDDPDASALLRSSLPVVVSLSNRTSSC